MGPQYRLSILQGWSLEFRGIALDIPSRKGRALLAFLALSGGQWHSRESVAATLWGDQDQRLARTSLRQVLAGIAKALQPHDPALLRASTSEVGFALDRIETDVELLFRAIAADQTADEQTLESLARLPDLLSDLATVSPAFEAWASQKSRNLVAQAQRHLQDVLSDPGRPLAVRLRAAKAAYELDDLDEEAAYSLMACHAAAGNSAAALRIYGDFYARLQDELDAEPSRRTQDLAVEIKLMQVPTQSALKRPAEPVAAVATSVAVMPFEFLGAEPAPDFLALGLLDQITCHLASFRAPAVISSNSTRRYRGAIPDLRQISNDLNAKYVVTGSVLRQGDRAAIAVQLVETTSSLVLWADTYRCEAEALFDLRANIAESIARTIMPSINLAELRVANVAPPGSLGSYHLVLQAKDLIFRLNPTDFVEAGVVLEQAIAKEPLFAPAHALMGEWYALRLWQGWSAAPTEDQQSMERHVTRAVALSPGDGRAMALWGHCRVIFDRDYVTAMRLFDEAITLRPNDSETLLWTVPALAFNGQSDRAVDHGRRSIDLSPLDPFLFRNEHFLSIALHCAGEFDEAAEKGLSCFRRSPDYASNLRMTIASLARAGRVPEAEQLVRHHARLLPDFSVAAFMPRHGLRDPDARAAFGAALVAAGMPP